MLENNGKMPRSSLKDTCSCHPGEIMTKINNALPLMLFHILQGTFCWKHRYLSVLSCDSTNEIYNSLTCPWPTYTVISKKIWSFWIITVTSSLASSFEEPNNGNIVGSIVIKRSNPMTICFNDSEFPVTELPTANDWGFIMYIWTFSA